MSSANINFPFLDFPLGYNFGSPTVGDFRSEDLLNLQQPRVGSDEAYATQELSINVFDNVDPSNNNENKQPPLIAAAHAMNKLYGNENQQPPSITAALNKSNFSGNENKQPPPTTAAQATSKLSGNENKQPLPTTADGFLSLFNFNENEQLQSRTEAHALWYSNLRENNTWQYNSNDFAELQLREMKRAKQELTVNVDAEEESDMHSWRPNLTDSLTSDVFVAQSSLDNAFQSNKEQPLQLFLWDSPIREESLLKTDVEANASHPDNSANYPQIDVQNHLQNQRTLLNCLKYEIINAKRKLHEAQGVVSKLSCELEEKLLFKNSKEMKVLRDENEELRIECQCLCSEVDYYLRGKAPLGDVDENFWEKLAGNNKPSSIVFPTDKGLCPPPLRPQKFNSEEQEEANKWNCPRCTFANHPAISSCEMCNVERIMEQTTLSHSSDNCFCHPKPGPYCS